jgi:hypothetical protein
MSVPGHVGVRAARVAANIPGLCVKSREARGRALLICYVRLVILQGFPWMLL